MPSDSDHRFVKEMKIMLDKLNEYYGHDCDLSVFDKAMLLDPRFKNASFVFRLSFARNDCCISLWPVRHLLVMFSHLLKKDGNRGKLIKLLGDMPKVRAAEERAKIELQRYMADVFELAADNIDLLLWWKQNCCHYPLLSSLVKNIFPYRPPQFPQKEHLISQAILWAKSEHHYCLTQLIHWHF